MANRLKLTTKNITQSQIDKLVRIFDSLNPIICNHAVSDTLVAVSPKEFNAMVKAEKAFDQMVR